MTLDDLFERSVKPEIVKVPANTLEASLYIEALANYFEENGSVAQAVAAATEIMDASVGQQNYVLHVRSVVDDPF